MSLLDAVVACGKIPAASANRNDKKRFAEVLSNHLAQSVAEGLRAIGFAGIKPVPGGPGEKAFQGGLGPKKVDVAFSDERHGLKLAVSIKSITAAPYGKNLKNRFADLCTEAITLHMRFPYSVVCALFAFPAGANEDGTERKMPTFERATELLATVDGRGEASDPQEKFENISMLLFRPVDDSGERAWIRLVDVATKSEMAEPQYFSLLRDIYNKRNPHARIGEDVES